MTGPTPTSPRPSSAPSTPMPTYASSKLIAVKNNDHPLAPVHAISPSPTNIAKAHSAKYVKSKLRGRTLPMSRSPISAVIEPEPFKIYSYL